MVERSQTVVELSGGVGGAGAGGVDDGHEGAYELSGVHANCLL